MTTLTCSVVRTSGVAPSPRCSHAAVADGDIIYIFGGGKGSPDSNFEHFNDLYALDTATWEWMEIPCPQRGRPSPRRGHTLLLLPPSAPQTLLSGRLMRFLRTPSMNRPLLVQGGFNDEEFFHDMYLFSSGPGDWARLLGSPILPETILSFIQEQRDRVLLISDGCDWVCDNLFRRARFIPGFALCFRDDEATPRSSSTIDSSSSAARMEGVCAKIYAYSISVLPAGHLHDSLVTSSGDVAYHPITPKGDCKPEHRMFASLTFHDGALWLFGGASESADAMVDMYRFDLFDQTWERVSIEGDVPSPRNAHTLVSCGRKLVGFGGGTHPHEYRNDVFVLQQEWTDR